MKQFCFICWVCIFVPRIETALFIIRVLGVKYHTQVQKYIPGHENFYHGKILAFGSGIMANRKAKKSMPKPIFSIHTTYLILSALLARKITRNFWFMCHGDFFFKKTHIYFTNSQKVLGALLWS
jgi:hypothetical protein